MQPSKKVSINGRLYAVRPLSPMDAYDFFVEHTAGKNPASIKRKALSRCITPDGQSLSFAETFNAWFYDHPSDLLRLGDKATAVLAADFGMPLKSYRKARYELMRGIGGKNPAAIPDGWAKTSFFGRIVNAGQCGFKDLVEGAVTVEHVFEMHRMLDLRDYFTLKALEHAKSKPKRR